MEISSIILNLFFRLLLTMLFFQLPLAGQTSLPQCPEEPFFLSPIDPICADKNTLVTYSFTIVNEGDPGDYEIIVPGRIEPLIVTGIQDRYQFRDSLIFECDNMPGEPNRPTASKPYYEYLINVKRTNCVDPNNAFYEISPSLKVYPNVLQPFEYVRSTCIDPLCIEFVSQVCDTFLVKDYEWFLDDVAIAMSNNDTLRYCFPDEGMYNVGLQITSNGSCSAFKYSDQISVTADPSPRLNLGIDSTQLCQDTIIIPIVGTAKYVDTYRWSSVDDRIIFSDPSISNPIVTIVNTAAGTYTFQLAATNANCGTVIKEFEISTLTAQSIGLPAPIEVCQDAEIAICDYFELLPSSAHDIQWSALDAAVQFSNRNILCPNIRFLTTDNTSLLLSGRDLCDNPFTFTLAIKVRQASAIEINFENLGILCEDAPGIQLLDYVSLPNEIKTCKINGNISEDCWFDPSQHRGQNAIVFEDSCGIIFEEQLLVSSQRIFEGGDPRLCIGLPFQLTSLQEGIYSGPNINNNIFFSETIGTYPVEFQDTSSCGGISEFQITAVAQPTAGFHLQGDECLVGIDTFPLGTTLRISSSTESRVIKYEVPQLSLEIAEQESFEMIPSDTGNYTIIQIVETGRDCRDTIQATILIAPTYQPIIEITVDSTSCDSISLAYLIQNPIAAYQYNWIVDDTLSLQNNNTGLTLARPFQSRDVKTELVIVTPCKVLDTIAFTHALGGRFQASLDILNDNDQVCAGSALFITNTSSFYDSLAYHLDGKTFEELEQYNLQNETDSLKSYEIILEGFKAGCPISIYRDTVEVLPKDTKASFSLRYETLCSPAPVYLQNSSTPGSHQIIDWGDGSTPEPIESLAEVEHIYSFTVDTTIQITLVSTQCSTDTIRKELKILAAPTISFETVAVQSFCSGDTIHFLPSTSAIMADLSLFWDFGDGSPVSSFAMPSHVYKEAGSYNVALQTQTSNGCSSILQKQLNIKDYSKFLPQVNLPRQQCLGQELDLQIDNPGNKFWIDYGNGIASPDPLSHPYQAPGTYIVEVINIDQFGCSVDTSMLLEVLEPLSVMINQIENQLDLGDDIALSFSNHPERNLQNIYWKGAGIQDPLARETIAIPPQDGQYLVIVEDEFGCTASDSIYIQLKKNYDTRVFIPNAFSPNGDGLNDTFFAHAKPHTVYAIKTFRIFDRTGTLVYECDGQCPPPNSPEAGWNGYFRGRLLNPAVFTWFIELEYMDGYVGLLKGDVTLVH